MPGVDHRERARVAPDAQRVDLQDPLLGDNLSVDAPLVGQIALRNPFVEDLVAGFDDDLLVVGPRQAHVLHRVHAVDEDVVTRRGVVVIALVLVAGRGQEGACEECCQKFDVSFHVLHSN